MKPSQRSLQHSKNSGPLPSLSIRLSTRILRSRSVKMGKSKESDAKRKRKRVAVESSSDDDESEQEFQEVWWKLFLSPEACVVMLG